MKQFAAFLLLIGIPLAGPAAETRPNIDEGSFSAKIGRDFAPVNKWHTSYLVVDSVDSSTIFAMSADGTVRMYRPYAVDGNVYECGADEQRVGFWCVSDGKLYRHRRQIAVECGGHSNSCGYFYIDAKGKICAFPNKDDGYDGQCEDQGREDAQDYFKTYPRN